MSLHAQFVCLNGIARDPGVVFIAGRRRIEPFVTLAPVFWSGLSTWKNLKMAQCLDAPLECSALSPDKGVEPGLTHETEKVFE